MSSGIKDIKGLMGLYPWYRPALFFGILAVLALAAMWRFYRRRTRPPAETIPPRPVFPPHQIALGALERILAQIEAPNPKPFYFELSEIVRAYIESLYRLPATDRTTEELQGLLEGSPGLPSAWKTSLVKLLREADQVKFTDQVPSVGARREIWDIAHDFVKATSTEGGA